MSGYRLHCTYLACPNPPTHRVAPPWGTPWFGCDDHYAAMAESLKLGKAQSVEIRVDQITPEVLYQWGWTA